MNWKMKLLIAYDGSEYSHQALDDLPRAGLRALGAVTCSERPQPRCLLISLI